MNFEVGAVYYTRGGDTAKIIEWNRNGKYFKAKLNSTELIIVYDESGDAVSPKFVLYDLMRRVREESTY
jgi:hypothetical protein